MVTAASHDAPSSNGADCVEMMESCELRRRGNPGNGNEAPPRCGDGGSAAEDEAASVERAFADKPVPSWREQLTVRAFVVSFFLAVMFSVIVMKLNLTTGIIPSLNVSAGLLGFFFVRIWTKAIESVGLLKQPFTRQENTVIQTCVVAAYGLAFSGKESFQAITHAVAQFQNFLYVLAWVFDCIDTILISFKGFSGQRH
jgi:hypothetical protein